MKEDAAFLDEVVVVGYGTARKKDVSGAIASVNYANDENLVNLPNPNALAALSSKVAGLSYAPTTSAAGDNTATMTIRGKNAIPTGGSMSASAQSVNQPLLVIDGVLSYGSINSINTADIESIDVLKDASAAAIYGSRAANGVIIITTKKGTSSAPVVNFNGSVSISDWSRMPKMVSDKETFLKNRFYSKKGAGDANFENKEWNYSSLDAAANDNLLSTRELEAWNDGQWVNWLDEISRKGVGQKYDVSVSGRAERVNYYVSGDYTRQQGIRKGDDYEKAGAMGKIDFNITDWLTVGAKANFLASNSWGQSANLRYAMWYTPLSYVYARQEGFENWYNSVPDNNTASPFIGTGSDDSYAYTDRQSKSMNLNGVAYAQIDFPFIPGLSYKVTFQGQRNAGYSDVYNNPEMNVNTEIISEMLDPSRYIGNVTGSISASNYAAWNIDQILTYNKDIALHHFDVTLGYTRESTNSNSLGTNFAGYPTPTTLGVYNIETANSVTGTYRNRTQTQSVGYLARVNYNWANKYYLTGNFRRDGFSAFAVGHKWGNFYGASAAWVVSNEDFMKDDPNDFRGSEVMIQRDYYTPSGKKWSEVKKEIKARVDAGLYEVTASDTVNITPRFWKFSDDKHVINSGNCYYDTYWYMIRIAETYLLRAEARLAQGNKSGAAEDINVLRNRAGAKPVAAGDVDIDYILDERVRELFGEEQRWITLSRLSCNPNATYVLDKYPTQNAQTSNTLYERTRKYGWGHENDLTAGRRETYVDALGNTRHIPNIQPYNYVLPIPVQIIQSNKDVKIPQNYGYGEE